MRRKIFIADLKEGIQVESIFLVKLKTLHYSKNGKPYLNIILTDKTGEIESRIWDNATKFNDKFEKDDFVYIKGRVSKYLDKNQVVITEIQRIGEDLVNLSDFQPTSVRNIEEMKDEMKELIATVENEHLKRLLNKIFSQDSLTKQFFAAPAAKMVHHAFIGGLIEHSLNLAKMAGTLRPFYPMINFDLVVTGLLLHDIGKIKELAFSKSFGYTTEGRLIGHIVLGMDIVNSTIKEISDFPEDLRVELLHIILSHHGSLEFGSPKRPKTLEAIITHHLDDMDSKIHGIHQFAKEDPNLKTSSWTTYHKFYERYFYFPRDKDDSFEKEKMETLYDETQSLSATLGNTLADEVKKKLQKESKTEDQISQDDINHTPKPGQELFDF